MQAPRLPRKSDRSSAFRSSRGRTTVSVCWVAGFSKGPERGAHRLVRHGYANPGAKHRLDVAEMAAVRFFRWTRAPAPPRWARACDRLLIGHRRLPRSAAHG